MNRADVPGGLYACPGVFRGRKEKGCCKAGFRKVFGSQQMVRGGIRTEAQRFAAAFFQAKMLRQIFLSAKAGEDRHGAGRKGFSRPVCVQDEREEENEANIF